MKQQSSIKKATFAVIASSILFGFSFMASRIAMQHTTPAVMLALRFIFALLILSVLIPLRVGSLHLKGKPIARFLLLGLCQPVIYFFGESAGIKYTNSSFSSIIIALIPVTAALLAAALLKERLGFKKLMWILCSLVGVVLISVMQEGGVVQAKGIVCLLVAVFAASFFALLSRSLSDNFSPFERTYIIMLMGSIAFTSTAVVQEGSGVWIAFAAGLTDPNVLLPVLYLAVFSSVAAFFCQNYAVTYLTATRMTAFSNITPVVSVLAGVFLLHEPFSLIQVPGILLILLGVYMVNREK